MIILQKNMKEHNPNWLQLPDLPYRILITGGCGSWKTNSLFKLISHKQNIDKIYSYIIDPYDVNYQLLINKGGSTGFKFVKILKLLLNT